MESIKGSELEEMFGKQKKIIVVTTALHCGGITSFLIPIVNELSKENDVTLAFTKDCGEFCGRISENVRLLRYVPLTKKQRITAAIKKLNILDLARVFFRNRKKHAAIASVQRLGYIWAENTFVTDEKYDVAISTAEFFCNALVVKRINATKKIGWVHPDMSALRIDLKAASNIIEVLDKLVAVSEVGLNSLRNLFPEHKDKFLYIENMLDEAYILSKANEPANEFDASHGVRRIVTVCRIDNSSKRLDRIVKIAKILKNRGVSFKWYIVGDGGDYESINSSISQNELQEFIFMVGRKLNPYPYIKNADCFVLTSQYEGKPIVIEEAKILHTPIVVTEYTSAHNQIPETMGAVVENCDGILEEKIASYISDNAWLEKIRHTNKEFASTNAESWNKINNLIG